MKGEAMREADDLRYARQAAFDLPDRRFRRVEIGGREWMFYDNANLSIHVTDKCNADCGFCVAHLRYSNEGRVYDKGMLGDDGEYAEALGRALAALADVDPSVSITGGEPTVNRRLPMILDTVAAAGARKRTLTTNGTGLLMDMGGSTVVERLGRYGLEHLNVSRAHHDDGRNSVLMGMRGEALSEGMLAEAVGEARARGMRVRMSCALLRDGVSDLAGMEEYAEWAMGRIGADSVIFRELMGLDATGDMTGPVARYCEGQRVGLGPLWEEMDGRRGFERVHQVLGYYYYVEVWRGGGGRTWVSEAADLGRLKGERLRHGERFGMPTAFEAVFHPNGNLCAGWLEDGDVILGVGDGRG